MSDSERAKPEEGARLALSRLEEAVDRVVADRQRLARRAQDALERIRELEAILAESDTAAADVSSLQEACYGLQRENESLRRKIAEGRKGVEGLLSRLALLEDRK